MLEFIYNTVKDLTPFLAAFIAFILGLKAFYIHKEYDVVRKRYLEDGLDLLTEDIEHALMIFKKNWSHSLKIIRQFKNSRSDMRVELLEVGFLDYDMSKFRISPNYRVNTLLGDDVIWKLQQHLVVIVMEADEFMREEVCGVIRHILSGKQVGKPIDQIIETMFQECVKLWDRGAKYHILVAEIQRLSEEYERKKFTMKGIHNFKHTQFSKEYVSNLKKVFADVLSENDKAPNTYKAP